MLLASKGWKLTRLPSMHVVKENFKDMQKAVQWKARFCPSAAQIFFLELFRNNCALFLVCVPDMFCLYNHVSVIFNTNGQVFLYSFSPLKYISR